MFCDAKTIGVVKMCFRPPTATKPKKCPECGAMNPATAKNCIKCKAGLDSAEAQKTSAVSDK